MYRFPRNSDTVNLTCSPSFSQSMMDWSSTCPS
ncbi:hypothetical protein GECvBN5_gp141c [Salmonella phage GEC_vB_N5]|uniref:Uncharacterized protein n=1 Tax=Salmonella phage GEC_vB_N5 TaxID=2777378 RepID=A0A7S9XED8_9CAUD|nr:hypothetical protein GECvBN5_gp141c [Salmonella phage GEC_vB_N5]